jgi:hypothetical protein
MDVTQPDFSSVIPTVMHISDIKRDQRKLRYVSKLCQFAFESNLMVDDEAEKLVAPLYIVDLRLRQF